MAVVAENEFCFHGKDQRTELPFFFAILTVFYLNKPIVG
jgi:hypothetical protein